jgi:hypothetical protein
VPLARHAERAVPDAWRMQHRPAHRRGAGAGHGRAHHSWRLQRRDPRLLRLRQGTPGPRAGFRRDRGTPPDAVPADADASPVRTSAVPDRREDSARRRSPQGKARADGFATKKPMHREERADADAPTARPAAISDGREDADRRRTPRGKARAGEISPKKPMHREKRAAALRPDRAPGGCISPDRRADRVSAASAHPADRYPGDGHSHTPTPPAPSARA